MQIKKNIRFRPIRRNSGTSWAEFFSDRKYYYRAVSQFLLFFSLQTVNDCTLRVQTPADPNESRKRIKPRTDGLIKIVFYCRLSIAPTRRRLTEIKLLADEPWCRRISAYPNNLLDQTVFTYYNIIFYYSMPFIADKNRERRPSPFS